jgi:type III secretion protein R
MASLTDLPNFLQLAIFGLLVGLVPFVAILATSFVKLVVVMHILRNALGIQQIPPNMVINGLALILTVFIMAPVGMEMRDIFNEENIALDDFTNANYAGALEKSAVPLVGFLKKNATESDKQFFMTTTQKIWPKKYADKVSEDNMLILIPAFVISELTAAFKIGFLISLPFIIIDMVVANILLSLGMMMMSPIMVSTPFKLLLFVLVEGWQGLLQGLILSYQ